MCVFALSVVLVAWVGVLAYEEAMKTEQTKRNGEAWLKWLSEAAPKRAAQGFPAAACAATSGNLWGGCQEWLQGASGPLHTIRNPFLGGTLKVVPKCDPSDRSLVGALAIEKMIPTPPGSAVPAVISPLAGEDLIEQKVQLRLAVCDKGAWPIKIGEVEF